MRTFAKLLWALVDFRVFLWMTQQTLRAFLLKKRIHAIRSPLFVRLRRRRAVV